jgi:6-pyruvoyltetrahydropterin/6-carboxytetrahydropterin synthase
MRTVAPATPEPMSTAVSVTRKVRFSASRRLGSPALDAAANQRLFGRELEPHGHDFTLAVTVGGALDARTGMVVDLKALADLMRQEVVARVDHVDLGASELLGGLPPTSENLALAVWRRLGDRWPLPGRLLEVAIEEGGGGTSVAYRGE